MPDVDSESRLERIFAEASRRRPEERGVFLERACRDDAALRSEVESLLQAEARAGDFLERTVWGRSAETTERTLARRPRAGDGAELPPAVGRLVGAYRLLAKIGEGGMSTIYLAMRADDEYRKRVAIKLVGSTMVSAEQLRRFRAERQILASLDHPNIARLHDGGTFEGLPYFVMEYIEGEPLDAHCERHRLSIRERLELFRTVCQAVHYAHQNLVVHRDLKPGNILVTEEGVPKLLDFGIAKLLNPELISPSPGPTLTWHRVLTPEFASPEQVQGRTITTASDVYSLGVVLYQLLTGRLPHSLTEHSLTEHSLTEHSLTEKDPAEVERILTTVEPERPSMAVARGDDLEASTRSIARARGARPDQLRRQLAGDLDNIVLMALRKEPRRRYGSAEQLSEDLRRYLDGQPVLARTDTLAYRAGKFLSRNRLGVAASAAFLGLILLFSVLLGLQAVRLARERDQARLAQDQSEQMLNFIKDVFETVDPDELRGRALTVREVLERGMARAHELESQPELKAEIMKTLGDLYWKIGDYDRAEELYSEVLGIRRELFGDRQPAVAEALNALGTVLHEKGDYEAARRFYQEALALRRRTPGEESSEVVTSLNNLATLANDAGDYETAERLHQQAISIERRLRGGDNPHMALLLNNLATTYLNKGELDRAERAHREALDIRRRLLGENHPEVAESLNNLAVLLEDKGESSAAEGLYREALEIQRRVWGDKHPELARTLNNLAVLHHRQREHTLAEPLYREALDLRRELLGEDHPLVAKTLNNLSALKRTEGDYEAAEQLYRQSLAIWRRAVGETHPTTAYPLMGLGLTLIRKGEAEAAEPLLQRAVALRRDADVGEHLIAYAESILGECLVHLRRYEEAEALLLGSLPVVRAERGRDHRETREVLERTAALYRAWGKPEPEYRARVP